MLNKQESQTVELKQIWKDEYLKTICAFANSDGGNLYIGIDDNSTILDIDNIEKFKIWTRKRAPFVEQEKDLKTLLKRLNLYDGDSLKRAAILLFGKNPQQYFIQSHSKIGKFLSDSELLTSDIVEGNLFEQLQRIETLEYPYDAVREAIINALIHRDYTDTTVLQIRVYDDKIVFSNGATLSNEVPIEKFKENHISKPFNPLIANMFYKAGFVESWGKGTNNMIDDCLKMNLPEPQYKYTFSSVQVTFYKTTQKTPQKTKDKILDIMRNNNKITINEISNLLSISRDTINEHIARLKNENKLQRVGGRKDGYWKAIDE
jgi:ATP-dependent DNA helicase RecG